MIPETFAATETAHASHRNEAVEKFPQRNRWRDGDCLPLMVELPAGEFIMGTTPDGIARVVELCRKDAGPVHDANWCQPTMLDDQEPEVSVLLFADAGVKFGFDV